MTSQIPRPQPPNAAALPLEAGAEREIGGCRRLLSATAVGGADQLPRIEAPDRVHEAREKEETPRYCIIKCDIMPEATPEIFRWRLLCSPCQED
jgi:hypothetical protein